MTRSGSYDYDIALLSDFRYPGGTSVSLAEEVKAQAAAGYTTVLVPARAPHLKQRRGFNRQIVGCVQAGLADLATPDQELRVRALVIRHPAIFTESPDPAPRVTADVVVMVVNQPPTDSSRAADGAYYDATEVRDLLEESFGTEVLWAPIGPLVREALEETGVSLQLRESDWHNVLDASGWRVDRRRYVSNRPVIGRHARPHWHKWPDSAEAILAAYPDDDAFEVKVLGGGEVATKILGRIPRNWTLYPFNSVPPKRFLREIDFEVYYHHPHWIEAFGRTIVEALASACPTVVAPHFRALFQDACVYSQPENVPGVVSRLYADPPAYREQAERGYTFAKENFGWEAHQQRIAELIGEPAHRPPHRQRNRAQRTVIFFTSNGLGMGHLTRQLALARRSSSEIRPVFATLSKGMRVVRDAGYLCEYIPRNDDPDWHQFLEQRLTEIIRRYGAEALIFDGTVPYRGLIDTVTATGVRSIWLRRAMWKRGIGEKNIARAEHFDLIVEPGELAEAYDRGATVARRDEAVRVAPVLLLDQSELLDATEAKKRLGIAVGKRAALIQLGAGNLGEGFSSAHIAAEELLRVPDLEVFYADWIIALDPIELPSPVKRISTYPLSRYLRAFDLVVSASGYNSFHELTGHGIPTIFVPNTQTSLDDQVARARFADEAGAGICLDPFTPGGLERSLRELLQLDKRRQIAERCQELFPGNGAKDAIEAVEMLLSADAAEIR